jgi:hypothetical protein
LRAARICGVPATATIPVTPIARNQTTMIGPKMWPTFSVPRDWIRKSASSSAAEIGTMYAVNALEMTLMPSTAEMTEIAGVMTPSPSSIEAPIVTTTVIVESAIGPPSCFVRGVASASSARIPPSPS